MRVSIRRLGRSLGVVIPHAMITELGLDGSRDVEMRIEDGALVLRGLARPVRAGWAEAARKISRAGDQGLLMGEFGNAKDCDLVW